MTMTKEEVVQRLRAAHEEESQSDIADGKEAGRTWAEREATPKELRRLQAFKDGCRDWEKFQRSQGRGSSSRGASERLYFAIHPEHDGERTEASDFWEAVLGGDDKDRAHDPAFVWGFAEGALEVWDEHKDDL